MFFSLQSMSKYIAIIIAVALVYSAGYIAGDNSATAYYKQQWLEAATIYQARIEAAEVKASEISQEYLVMSHDLSAITNSNRELVKRLQQLESSTSKSTNKNPRCIAKCPACPPISSGMAQYVTGITERADAAALYATQCHKWILGLKKGGSSD